MSNNKKLVNLTRNTMTFLDKDGNKVIIPPSGTVATVTTSTKEIDYANGVPIVEIVFSEVKNLPEPEEGVYYVVSAPVRNALGEGNRPDVVASKSPARKNGVTKYAQALRVNG